MDNVFLGLRTVIYPAPDLDAQKLWFTRALGVEPYFDQPFYVGFNIGGYELGLDPNAHLGRGPVTYWGVHDIESTVAALVDEGAAPADPVTDVGEGIKVATVNIPGTDLPFGVIENPNFKAAT